MFVSFPSVYSHLTVYLLVAFCHIVLVHEHDDNTKYISGKDAYKRSMIYFK